MLLPYALPHECESEEIARALGGLTPKQRRALRAYVWQVELGEQTVTGWLASDTCPVARQSWYRSDGGYWGNGEFRRALELYLAAGLKWRTAQDRRDVERARRSLLLAAPKAAERLVDQLDSDIGSLFKTVERWTDAPLPSQEVLREERREFTDEHGQTRTKLVYLVRQSVVDMERLRDPQFSRRVKKFSDSPRSGISVEMYDALGAAESILDRADLETAAKTPTPVGVQVIEVVKDYGVRGDAERADAIESAPGADGGMG